MRKLDRMVSYVVALLFALCAVATPVHADLIDMLIPAGLGGSLSYAGGAAPLVGAGIGSVTGPSLFKYMTFSSDTSPNVGICISCSLGFTSGAHIPSAPGTWQFAAGAPLSFTVTAAPVTGGIDTNFNGVADIFTTSVMTGQITSAKVEDTGPGTLKLAVSTVITTIDPALLAFLGLPTTPQYAGIFHLDFNAPGAPPLAFTSTSVGSGDLNQSPVVPEPGTLMLLGSGLLGFGYLRMRRRVR